MASTAHSFLLLVAVPQLLCGSSAHVTTTTTVFTPTLPIEVHSHNDLNAWPPIWAVGTRFVKTDIGLCDENSCRAGSTFGRSDLPGYRGNASDCFTVGGANYCCLCMRGDASTRPTITSDPFNTTWDLVAYLSNAPPTVPRWNTLQPGDRPLYIGLDFGGSPGCDGGLAASPPCPAFALLSSWMLAMHGAIESNGLAVIPYGDAGIGAWLVDLDVACGPNATAPRACSDVQRALQALPWYAETAPPFPPQSADPSGRFRVANGDWTADLPAACSSGSGGGTSAFNASDTDSRAATPYLWYEQQDEFEFAQLLSQWRGCPAKPAHRASPNTGIVAVSNVGPAMFELFTSNALGRGLSVQFTNNTLVAAEGEARDGSQPPAAASMASGGSADAAAPSLPAGLTRPLLVLLNRGPTGPAGVDRWAVLLTHNDSDPAYPSGSAGVSVLGVVDGQPPSALRSASGSLTIPLTAAGDAVVAFSSSAARTGPPAPAVLVAAFVSSGGITLVSIDTSTGGLDNVTTVQAPDAAIPAGASVVGGALLSEQGSDSLGPLAVVLVAGQAPAGGASGWLNVTALRLPPVGYVGTATLLSSVRVQSSVAVTAGASITLALAPAQSGSVSGKTGAATFTGLVVYGSNVTGGLGRAELFGAAVTVMANSESDVTVSVRWGGMDGPDPRPPRVGFGAVPHLSVSPPPDGTGWGAANASDPLVLLLATAGDCDCGLLLNNANFARCQLGNPAVDGNILYSLWQSVPGLLTYSFGPLSAFDALVTRPPLAPGVPWDPSAALGSCHPSIAHGKLTSAASAAGALYPVLAAHPSGETRADGSELFGPPVPEVAVLATHDGHVFDSLQTLTLCGLPDLRDGLVWDAWRLPQAPFN